MKSILAFAVLTALPCVDASAGDAVTPPEVPAALRAPAGQTVFLEAFAKGVQIYECVVKADQPAAYEWKLTAPEAVLADASGKTIGKHFAGPTWEAGDGSSVVGEVKARDPGPGSSIPWLLLTAKSTSGNGLLSTTKSVQRVDTVGGVAPAELCNATQVKQVARIAYTAKYYFYR
jgi:uncharacterized protein DUF3455